MKYLFIDTHSASLCVSIIENDIEIKTICLNCINEHSKYLLVEIQKLLLETNTKPKDIKKIFVVNGPGSFTGIRIGVTVAKTYAYALNIPVIPISSLKSYALSYSNYDYYVSVIDARRGYVYSAVYDKNKTEILDEKYRSIDELNSFVSSLNGKVIVLGNININVIYDYKEVELSVKNIYDYYKDNEDVVSHALNPNYLKKVEAEEKLEC